MAAVSSIAEDSRAAVGVRPDSQVIPRIGQQSAVIMLLGNTSMTFSSLSESSRSHSPQRRLDPRLDSPAQLALGAVVLWLVGAMIHPLGILAALGLILLLVAGVAYLLRPRTHTMYWRGRRIDLPDEPGPAQQLYRLFFRR
jgi:cbb3-type cytochrome oxidase subunit 3